MRLADPHGQHSIDRPPSAEPQLKGASADAEQACPLGQGVRFAVVGQLSVCALVVCLIDVRGPAHVARLVAAIVVDAIERVFGRGTRSHIAKERRERGAPFIVDADAAAAVVLVLFVALTMTSGLHSTPDFILRGVCAAVGCQGSSRALWFHAPAGLAFSLVQGIDADRSFRAAFATTEHALNTVLDALPPRTWEHAQNGPMAIFHGMNYSPGYVLNVQTGTLEPKPQAEAGKKP